MGYCLHGVTYCKVIMKSINTLVADVYSTLERYDGWFDERLASDLGIDISKRLQGHLGERSSQPTLRLSQMGPRCPRALWHSIHTPELAEPLPPWARFKYAYGHIIEALAIALSKAAGHSVTGEQDAVEVDGVVGHRDCVIDGCIVDVKSTSSYGFQKFKDKTIAQDDSFGYLDQLDGYTVGSSNDPLVLVKDKAYNWAIDKTLGKMCLYEHHVREQSIRTRVKDYRAIVERITPPNCTCGTVFEGKSGNVKLDVRASYSAYKHCCFPSLRTFLYASGPVYLTKVVRKPDVTEIDRYGKAVYH